MRITEKHIRAFVAAAEGIEIFEDTITSDHWIEFPARATKRLLEDYYKFLGQSEDEWVDRPFEG